MTKIQKLAEIEGYSDEYEMSEELGDESVIPGICMNKGCDYTSNVEPDCSKGYCEVCKTQTVQSFMVLLGVI